MTRQTENRERRNHFKFRSTGSREPCAKPVVRNTLFKAEINKYIIIAQENAAVHGPDAGNNGGNSLLRQEMKLWLLALLG